MKIVALWFPAAISDLCVAGCDALSVHLAVTCIGTSIGVGFTKWTVLGVMSIMGPWLLAHWEEYHSGIMLYGNGYWGVTEANYLMVLLHFFTAAVGPGGDFPSIITDCLLL